MNQLEISFGSPLHVVVHQQGPLPSYHATFTMETEYYTVKGENMANTMSVGSLATLSVQWSDAGGNPAPVDGPTSWVSSDPTVATATVATGNPLICNIKSLGPIGNVQIQATADADMGPSVHAITAVCDITVIAGQASAGSISFSQSPAQGG